MSLRFNPLSGNFDWDTKVGSSEIAKIACEKAVEAIKSIVTTDVNALGNKNFYYDPKACKWVSAGPQLVTDDDGVIMVGIDCDE